MLYNAQIYSIYALVTIFQASETSFLRDVGAVNMNNMKTNPAKIDREYTEICTFCVALGKRNEFIHHSTFVFVTCYNICILVLTNLLEGFILITSKRNAV